MRRQFFCGLGKYSVLTIVLLSGLSAHAQEVPKMGGALKLLSVYSSLPPLSWDTADWIWKQNHDMCLVYERLFAADLGKAKRHGGSHNFRIDAWVPKDAMREELAKSWRWTEPETIEVVLRKGVMFLAKPGVTDARELTAEDVVYSYTRMNNSPRKVPNVYDHIKSVKAKDRYTVVFNFKKYNTESDYRYGWGYYSSIAPKEVVTAGASDWKNLNGTGSYKLTNYTPGSASVFTRNNLYYDIEKVDIKYYKMPFLDKIVMRTIKDPSSRET